MNKRVLTLATGFLAVLVFAAGAYVYSRSAVVPSANAPAAETSTLVRPHSPVMGPPDAPVTIVEFFDPSCEACRAFFPIVKQIMEANPDKVRVVIRYTPFHPASEEAIRILEASRMQDKFLPVLGLLLQRQDEWGADGAPNPARAWEVASAAGLDIEKARQDAASAAVDAVIRQDLADVQAANVTGTPTFFVNGKPLPSFGADELIELVSSEVKGTLPDS